MRWLLALSCTAHADAVDASSRELTSHEVRVDDYVSPSLQEECPTCVYDVFECFNPLCNEQTAGALTFQHLFDFEYWHEGCVEEITRNDRQILLDRDVWCMDPTVKDTLTCETMRQEWSIQGAGLFETCYSDTAELLLRETCGWSCKAGRPVLRCVYEFDPTGTHGYVDGESHIDFCYVEGMCVGQEKEARLVVCDGTALSHNYAAALDQLERYTAEPHAHDIVEELRNVKKDHQLAKSNLNKAVLEQDRMRTIIEDQRHDLRSEESKSQTLTVVLGVLSAAFVVAVAVGLHIAKKRKPVEIVVSSRPQGGPEVANATVVMGRNVAAAEVDKTSAAAGTAMQVNV